MFMYWNFTLHFDDGLFHYLAVDCKWGEWEAWGDCPSGCDQKKTRVRQMAVEASCNGVACEGEDYEKKICSREEELSVQIRALLDENEALEKNQCTQAGRKKRLC